MSSVLGDCLFPGVKFMGYEKGMNKSYFRFK